MSAAGHPAETTPSDLRAAVEEAEFVRLVAATDADSVAAAGLLADALDHRQIPYQMSVTPLEQPAQRSTDTDLLVAVGRPVTGGDLTIGLDDAATRTAHTVARELGAGDLPLALAGAVAAEGHPGDELATVARQRGIERRPGVAVPTADPADGLAHSTLVHAPFSGRDDIGAELGVEIPPEPTEEDRRRLASAVALSVAGDPAGVDRGSEAVERLLRPLAGGPFGTIGGYADLLSAVAREQSGLAVALALGRVDAERALDCWRRHGASAHEAIRTATTSRYDGLFVVQCSDPAPVCTVAELVAAYRSPEPVVLAVDSDRAAVTTRAGDPVDFSEPLDVAATTVDGTSGAAGRRGRAAFSGDATEFVAAFTEAV
ncbi:hypothetical protein GRX03_11470 [Halovenus sp. WSH3]|uniref:Exonuclease RecJ n=1 Tax=Halovenus carboxidivorans TaxID=2692199 RepID=A0A6B0T1W9_9EURY|nr:hypothetical protein [Halovenus carboxidivorans]MXR52218.1 hypothetical protein [Halovenus carboxidivorans]